MFQILEDTFSQGLVNANFFFLCPNFDVRGKKQLVKWLFWAQLETTIVTKQRIGHIWYKKIHNLLKSYFVFKLWLNLFCENENMKHHPPDANYS